MTRKEIIAEVETLMNQYCKGCFLYNYLKNEKGRRQAHRFCINQCTVGEKIKEYGTRLS